MLNVLALAPLLFLKVVQPVIVTHANNTGTYWTATSEAGGLNITVKGNMEFDSFLEYGFTLTPLSAAVTTHDVRLRVSYSKEHAKYMIGFSQGASGGGQAPQPFAWKWSTTCADNMMWAGRVEAGLFLKLKGVGDNCKWILCSKAIDAPVSGDP